MRIDEVDENELGQLVYGLESTGGYIVVTAEGRDKLVPMALGGKAVPDEEIAEALDIVRPRHAEEWRKRWLDGQREARHNRTHGRRIKHDFGSNAGKLKQLRKDAKSKKKAEIRKRKRETGQSYLDIKAVANG